MDYSGKLDIGDIDYNSRKVIGDLISSRNWMIQQRFGQNFLINSGAREHIIELLEVEEGDDVWEIGPGLGAMTSHLVPLSIKLTLFEIDKGYIDFLKEITEAYSNIDIVSGDAVKRLPEVYAERLNESRAPQRIMGNLPYNSASSIILKMIQYRMTPERAVFTVQDEMADRVIAGVGSKNYSSFSILCQTYFKITKCSRLSAGSFYPPPRVHSAIIKMEPLNEPKVGNHEFYFHFIRDLFASRRKTLRNNIKKMGSKYSSWNLDSPLIESVFIENDIKLERRPETLSVQDIINLSEKLIKAGELCRE